MRQVLHCGTPVWEIVVVKGMIAMVFTSGTRGRVCFTLLEDVLSDAIGMPCYAALCR